MKSNECQIVSIYFISFIYLSGCFKRASFIKEQNESYNN